ncbi:lysophospholipid acyltransferase family protein [Serratia microhaemolytica]|uniref:lysophospholipid acyltransferase family protein n=1 Tax=Serratia microhaemolytica TaxID=2675110 RepID=UPI000FDF226E|nr:lysophospholipid acyltransferase family protein [Serratia microhaemolytica]
MRALLCALNRAWRLVMTWCCFALFGLGGLLLSLVVFNLMLVMVPDSKRRSRLARRMISLSFRLFLAITKFLRLLDYRIEGKQLLRSERGCVVVANHPTLLDYVLLASVMAETDCLVKSTLLKNPFVSGVIRAADYLVNSQGETLLAESEARLARGDTLLIFPEGTRTRQGETITLQRGAANIAVRCRSDLRIVVIRCSEQLLTKQSKWYSVPPSKPLFTITVQSRVSIDDFHHSETQPATVAARELNRYLLQQLQ